MKTHPRKLAALLLLSACCFTPAAIYAAMMASQPWVTNRIAEAEARTDAKIIAATNAIPRADLTAATNYTDRALGAFAATGKVARATSAISSESSGYAGEAVSATWASRLSDGGSVGADNFTYAGILAGFAAGTNYTDAVAAEFEDGRRTAHNSDNSMFAQIAVRLGDTDTSYTAQGLIRESTNAAIAVAASKQDSLPYPTNAIPYAAITGSPTPPSVFYDVAGGAATVSGATLTYQAASNSVGSVALLAGTNVLHITAPSAITGHVRDFGLTVTTEDAATITLGSSVSWRFDSASTNLAAGSWNRVYCTESPSGVFSLQLWTPDSAQEATP